MQDQKDKQNSLNPSQRDYDEKFNDMVSSPDMQAVDDQGDAIARENENNGDAVAHDLRRSEEGLGPVQRRLQRRDNRKQAAREAEAAEWNRPENRFGYKPPDKKSGKPTASTRRKNTMRLGIGGGVIVAVLALGGSLLPLKIPGIMQMISDEAAQRVEQITEKRAKMMVGRYILNRMAGGPRFVVTGEGAVSSLMATMRTARFEDKLAAKGIRIEGQGRNAKLYVQKEVIFTLGDTDIEKGTITVVQRLDGSSAGRKALNEVIKEEIPSWRWMKRAKFAKWLRLKYGIPRYGIENSKNSDEEERVKEMQRERLKTEGASQISKLSGVINCFMTTECDADVGDSKRPDIAKSNDGDAITDSTTATLDEYVEENAQNAGKGTFKGLYKMVLDKIGSKAIPIIGWIDLAATIDHISWEAAENDYFGKVVAYYRASQYAAHFGLWSGYGSQIQLGAMDPEFISVLATQTEGVEESEAFQTLEGRPGIGKEVKRINANAPSSGFAEAMKTFRQAMTSGTVLGLIGQLPGIPNDIGDKVVHYVLNAYYETIGGGGLLGWVSGLIGDLAIKIGTSLAPDSFENWLYNMISKLGTYFLDVAGLDFDPMIAGADWFNAAHGGATWTYNDFCKNELGCQKLSAAQTALQNSTVAVDRADYRNQQGLFYSLFSTDSSKSLTTQLAIHTPTDTASAASSIGRMISDTPATLLALVSGKTSASTYVDIHGVDPYGALSADLNKQIDPKAAAGDDCGESDGSSFNLCMADTLVAEAMICEFTPDIPDCSDTTTSSETDGWPGAKLRIASYNMKVSSSDAWNRAAVGNMKENNFDIVGMQELETRSVFQSVSSKLKDAGYSVYPTKATPANDRTQNDVRNGLQAKAIAYRTDKYTLVNNDEITVTRMGDGARPQPAHIPIIWLEDKDTGQVFIVINTHNTAYGPNGNGLGFSGPAERYDQAKAYTEKLKQLQSENLPIFFTGDFNEGYGPGDNGVNYTHLSHCMFRENNLLRAVEINNPGQYRKDGGIGGPIDHIYASPEVIVDKFDALTGTPDQLGTDHRRAPYADLTIPNTQKGLNLKVASFNILHSDDAAWKERLKRSTDVLKNKSVDVAGLQEVRPDQNKLFRTSEYGGDIYDMYPTALENPAFSPNPIIWDKSKFELIKTGSIPFKYFGGMNDKAPLVKLEDIATGQQFYFINTHDPADARGEAAHLRYQNALSYAKDLKELSKEGLPIFFSGDFNSGYEVRREGNDTYQYKRENLTYCILTDGTGLWDAYDAASSRKGKCPTTNYNPPTPSPGIDHIFLSTNLNVTKYDLSPAGKEKNGSDVHPTVIASVTMPSKGGGSVTGWQWPLKKNINNGPCYGGSSVHAGMDMNSSTDNNPVYAMHSGTVVTVGNDDAAGVYVTIKADKNFEGKPVYYSYEHLKSGSVRVSRGAQVDSGQPIAIAGLTGNVFVTSSRAHLHIVTATTNTLGSYGNLGTTFDPMRILKNVNPVPGGYKCY